MQDFCIYESEKETKICLDFLLSLLSFFYENTNFEVIYNEFLLNTDCYDEMENLIKNNKTEFVDLVSMNGKSLQDYGLEIECNQEGYNYYLISFNVDKTIYFKSIIINFINDFLNIKNYNVGICTPKKCNKLLVTFFNKTKNEKFYKYIESKGILDMKLNNNSRIESFSPEFERFLWVFICYLIIKTLFSLMSFFVNFEGQRIRKDSLNYQYYIEGKNKKY